jgi:hypothetical protein
MCTETYKNRVNKYEPRAKIIEFPSQTIITYHTNDEQNNIEAYSITKYIH